MNQGYILYFIKEELNTLLWFHFSPPLSDFIPSGFAEILSLSLGQVFAMASITSFAKEEISGFDCLLT